MDRQAPSSEDDARFDAAPCGLMQTDDDGRFLRVNGTFSRWVGYPTDELIGVRRFQDLLTVGARMFHQTHWAPLLRIQGSVSEVKLDVRHRDGTTIPMVLNAIRHAHDGIMVHEIAAFVARDRDKYEQELVRARRRLEELVAEATQLHAEAKDRALFAEQMMGIVSHDLRNPLSSIMMGTAILAHGGITESQRRTLRRIQRSAERASRLIADLLDFTQARLGVGLTLARAKLDLHATVGEAVEELATLYPGRTLNHVRLGAGPCSADADRLAQLVGNLVSNAMVYGTHGTPVTVTSATSAESVSVAVHNHGAPIPENIQRTLFEPMTRGEAATNAGRSVGLGLFIVSEIAKAHGGHARVHSTVADGTTFEVVFPAYSTG